MIVPQAIIAAQKDSKLQTPSREDMPRFPKKQRAWLTDQCRKLVSEKKGVRNVQLEEYKDKSKVTFRPLFVLVIILCSAVSCCTSTSA